MIIIEKRKRFEALRLRVTILVAGFLIGITNMSNLSLSDDQGEWSKCMPYATCTCEHPFTDLKSDHAICSMGECTSNETCAIF